MARIAVLHLGSPTASVVAVEAGPATPWRRGDPAVDAVAVTGGPAVIEGWRDWHAAAEPLCRAAAREVADVYLVAAAADPGLQAVQALTPRPVLGAFRCAVAAALTRAERFGVVAASPGTKGPYVAALQAMGVDGRLTGVAALDVPAEALSDPAAARGLLIDAATDLAEAGARAVVIGWAGMEPYRAAAEAAAGVPVIEPCAAGVAMALLALG